MMATNLRWGTIKAHPFALSLSKGLTSKQLDFPFTLRQAQGERKILNSTALGLFRPTPELQRLSA